MSKTQPLSSHSLVTAGKAMNSTEIMIEFLLTNFHGLCHMTLTTPREQLLLLFPEKETGA